MENQKCTKGGKKMGDGKILLEFRAKHNLTQIQLAQILDVTANMVHRYENGISEPTNKNKIVFENKMKVWEKNV